jgi:hypothetical protein
MIRQTAASIAIQIAGRTEQLAEVRAKIASGEFEYADVQVLKANEAALVRQIESLKARAAAI